MVQQLKEPDYEARRRYCKWFLNFLEVEGVSVPDKLFFTDEAWFHLDGQVNNQNSRSWCTANPREIREKPLHSAKISVWCAISRKRIVGPLFFDTTITAGRYQELVYQFISLLEPEERRCWFQQDGAPAHTAGSTMAMLEEFSGEKIISQGLWPPRSPDLTHPDFFLWGTLKGEVYATNPGTIEQLRVNITASIANVTPETLNPVFENKVKRIHACLRKNGGHFQQDL